MSTDLPENVVPIVFNCLEGSVSHYYHFLYGALIPLIEYHLSNIDKKLLITTDVGPFQSTLLDIFTPQVIVGFEQPIIPAGEKYFDDKSMNWIRTKRPDEVILPAYDVFNADIMRNRAKSQDKLRHLLSIRDTILQFMNDRIPDEYKHMQTFEIILIQRATEQYYIDKSMTNPDESRSIFYTSGKQRRDITNHAELLEGMKRTFPGKVGNIILEGKSIFYQFELFKRARIVIGQHGAGLANIFFMTPGTHMIEIMSPWGRRGDHFRNLANSLQINYNKFDLDKDIGPVDVNQIIRMVNNIYYPPRDYKRNYEDWRNNDRGYQRRDTGRWGGKKKSKKQRKSKKKKSKSRKIYNHVTKKV